MFLFPYLKSTTSYKTLQGGSWWDFPGILLQSGSWSKKSCSLSWSTFSLHYPQKLNTQLLELITWNAYSISDLIFESSYVYSFLKKYTLWLLCVWSKSGGAIMKLKLTILFGLKILNFLFYKPNPVFVDFRVRTK